VVNQARVAQAVASTCWWYKSNDNFSAACVLDGAAAGQLHHGFNQSINHSVNQSINQSITQSINQAIN